MIRERRSAVRGEASIVLQPFLIICCRVLRWSYHRGIHLILLDEVRACQVEAERPRAISFCRRSGSAEGGRPLLECEVPSHSLLLPAAAGGKSTE
jgi:hypothetical protein